MKGLALLPLALLAQAAFAESAVSVTVDLSAPCGTIKPLNGVNNGPVVSERAPELGNAADFAALEIPFVRTHDSSFWPGYGGEHTVDISAVFPDFSADENDPAAYDFTFTDSYLASIRTAGAKVYYRLGQRIEHGDRKYHTKPTDFAKWARICERVVARYPDVAYWEIWNEPDLSAATWGGTAEEFYDFFETVARHLKAKFPDRKIGGPGLAGSQTWGRNFLSEMHRRGVPLDFLSWHLYIAEPLAVAARAAEWRRILDESGYPRAESHLTEWNYIRGWRGGAYAASVETIGGVSGAAFSGAFLTAAQAAPVDVMTYYDARPSAYNGLFRPTDRAPRPTYWTFDAWRVLRRLRNAVRVTPAAPLPDVQGLAAADERRAALLLTRFAADLNETSSVTLSVSFRGATIADATVKTLDSRHAFQSRPATLRGGCREVTLEPWSVCLIEANLIKDPEK